MRSSGQAYIGHGAIADYLDGEHYLQITCTSEQRPPAPAMEPIQIARRATIPYAVPRSSTGAVESPSAAKRGARGLARG
jgi:hypothetical protein